MRKKNIIQFCFKLLIVILTLIVFFIDEEALYPTRAKPISFLGFLWLILMLDFMFQFFPFTFGIRGDKKQFASHYQALKVNDDEFNQNKKRNDHRATVVMIVWLLGNSVALVLYLFNIVREAHLVVLMMLYYLGDLVCVLFYCPFQDLILRSKCCTDCRIYGWGNIFIVTPMAFIFSFYSISLFVIGLALFILWEIRYHAHPERFYKATNGYLKCQGCTEKTCMKRLKIVTKFSKKEETL